MSEIEVNEAIQIKICLLGSEKVGKTYLAHKLTDLDYEEYRPAVECQKFIKQISEKKQILIYYDYPPICTSLVEEITRDHRFDMMVCLFKDSVSFGQLYEFFAEISKKIEENDHKFNEYWESIKNIILVYSDLDGKGQVQLQQLFSALTEQIRNFNRTASIKQFMLKPQLSNHQYLRYLIEKNKFSEHRSLENIYLSQEKQVKSTTAQKVSQMITEMPSSHYASQRQEEIDPVRNDLQDEEMPELAQVKLTSTKEMALSSQGSIQQEDNINTLGKKGKIDQNTQLKPQENIDNVQKSQQQCQTHDKISKDQKIEKPQAMSLVKQERAISVRDESQQTLQLFRQQDKIEQSKISIQENQKIKADQTLSISDKEKQHYQQVYNKLMAKIHKEEVQESKKASYQDLFQQFRRTSKEESKISKELHDYWQKKIQKLEQEDEQDDEEDCENDVEEEDQDQVRNVEPNSQQKPHPRSAEPHHKKHGEPLKPQSYYLETGKPRRQKSTKDSKPCFCSIM